MQSALHGSPFILFVHVSIALTVRLEHFVNVVDVAHSSRLLGPATLNVPPSVVHAFDAPYAPHPHAV